jgi:hypothetical protein
LQLTPKERQLRAKREQTLAQHGVQDFREFLEKVLYFSEQKWIY